jgi:hypothetical protein
MQHLRAVALVGDGHVCVTNLSVDLVVNGFDRGLRVRERTRTTFREFDLEYDLKGSPLRVTFC